MKRTIAALVLIGALLVGHASAAWDPMDLKGGSLSGITETEDGFLVTDIFNKIIWQTDAAGENVSAKAGAINVNGLDGEPIGAYVDGALNAALFMEPWAIAPYLDGYAVTDAAANVVRYISEDGVLTAVGNGKEGLINGTGTDASFTLPTGLAAGDDGELFIADTGNGAIRILSPDGSVTTLVDGLLEPSGLCWMDGVLYVAETGRNRICRIDGTEITVIAGVDSGEEDGYFFGDHKDGPVERAAFDHPQGIAVDEDGTIYVADTGNHAVRKISDGRVITLAVSREGLEPPVKPRGMLIKGNTLLVTDLVARTVLQLDLSDTTYEDVADGVWYAKAVETATERGIINGIGDNNFMPGRAVTRLEMVVMLSRMHLCNDGYAVIDGETSFEDLNETTPYAENIRWAADQNILQGMNGRFEGDLCISREQLVTLVYRYALCYGFELSGSADISIFSDHQSVSEYALPAVEWAVANGILNGMGNGTLEPQGTATRAQAAMFIIDVMDLLGL